MALLIFPLAVALYLFLVIRFGYRKPGEVNRVFTDYSRPPRLKTTIGFWLVGIAAVFLFIQWMRIPYYLDFASRLAHFRTYVNNPMELAIVAGLLVMLVSEWIIIGHWMIYLVYAWIGASRYRLPERIPLSSNPPEVLVLIACCNEDPEILQRSLETVSQLQYPRVRACLVENSRDLKLKALCTQMAGNYGIEVLHIRNRGHKAGAMNDAMQELKSQAPYVAVIDADQRVKPEFLSDLIPLLENDKSLAFVQTPQLYENAEETWLCRAAAQQEMLLYDTIMEAKSALQQTLCCGTNVVLRKRALEDVGGWDEHSVSEDLATSFYMNSKGWKSLYVRREYARGLGPLDLKGYWKQQKRWAVGNTTVVFQVLRAVFLHKPYRTPLKIAVGYFWSSAYYIAVMALAALATLPMLLILASYLHAPHSLQPVPAAKPIEWLFLSVYPFYVAVMMFPYIHMNIRGYPIRNLLMMQGLLAITFPIYVFSVFRGIVKHVTFFEIAPKARDKGKLSIWRGPQVLIMLVALTAGCILTENVVRQPHSSVSWIALFWLFFYTVSFSHYFLFAIESGRLLQHKPSFAKSASSQRLKSEAISAQKTACETEEN